VRIPFLPFELYLIKKPKCRYKKDDVVVLRYTPNGLHKQIAGGIIASCNAHPQIPRTLIGTIAKRIYGQLVSHNGIPDYMVE